MDTPAAKSAAVGAAAAGDTEPVANGNGLMAVNDRLPAVDTETAAFVVLEVSNSVAN